MMRADVSPSRRRAWSWVALLVVLALAIALLVGMPIGIRGAGPAGEDATSAASVTVQDRDRDPDRRATGPATGGVPESPARDSDARARRDRARTRILEALARRDATPAPTHDDRSRDDVPDRSRPAGGTITDRIGGRDALVAALDDDFMPLADECIEDARARDPSLQGMLAIELSVIADEEIGAVVETVEFPDSGDVHDVLLHECIRETSLSTILPPPPEGGREEFLLTLKVDP